MDYRAGDPFGRWVSEVLAAESAEGTQEVGEIDRVVHLQRSMEGREGCVNASLLSHDRVIAGTQIGSEHGVARED